MKSLLLLSVIGLVMASANAFAGGSVEGYGSNCTEARKDAMAAAAEIVKDRGKGCLGRKSGSATEFVSNKDGVCIIKAHYSHHNGSCGKNSTEEQALCKAIGISC